MFTVWSNARNVIKHSNVFLKVNKYQNERNVLCLCFNCSAALSAPFYDDTSDLIS